MSVLIIEGIDGVGKTSLCDSLKSKIGWFPVIKYEKPVKSKSFSQLEYQEKSFHDGFSLASHLAEKGIFSVFDRFHLGECVYSPMYRGYPGDYVFQIEAKHLERHTIFQNNLSLVLLVASNFEALKDDGQSFDREKVEEEQALFRSAFDRSCIHQKVVVNVHNKDGSWRTPVEILNDIAGAHIIPHSWARDPLEWAG